MTENVKLNAGSRKSEPFRPIISTTSTKPINNLLFQSKTYLSTKEIKNEKSVITSLPTGRLALIQTNHVIDQIKDVHPDISINVIAMTTKGDNVLDKPLPKVGKNVFTKELEDKLLDKSMDFVVHSMKDVSTSLPDGLTIGAILKREDPEDSVLTSPNHSNCKLRDLPVGSVVGTSSLRRAAQLRVLYPHLVVKDIRGNLNTRLRKLEEGKQYAAIVLALAGVRRMGWEDRVSEILPSSEMLYAVGQGALAVQCRDDDLNMINLLSGLNHEDTLLTVIAERAFMQALGGGCTAPLAVESQITEDAMTLTGGVWSVCGKTQLIHTMTAKLPPHDGEPPSKCLYLEAKQFTGITAKNVDRERLDAASKLGSDLAAHLTKLGAAEVIAQAKKIVDQPLPKEVSANGDVGNGDLER